MPHRTLETLKQISDRFKITSRLVNLSWSHHHEKTLMDTFVVGVAQSLQAKHKITKRALDGTVLDIESRIGELLSKAPRSKAVITSRDSKAL